MRDKIYKLLNELDDLLLISSVGSPQVKELIREVRGELKRSGDAEDTMHAPASELPKVPPESSCFAAIYSDDLLSDTKMVTLGRVDFQELLSAIWRRHAGKRYHMRWSDDGEMELVVDDVVSVRLERLHDGIRVRLAPYLKR